jgi:hypothetical protein
VLLGFDMRVEAKEHNWHEVYKPLYEQWKSGDHEGNSLPVPSINHYRRAFLNPFRVIHQDALELGLSIINTNSKSLLVEQGLQQYKPLEDLLA